MARNDLIGALCTFVVIGLVAWLSLESWKNADCRELLRTNDFARAGEPGSSVTAELSEFRAQLEAGKAGTEAESCVSRIGLPF
tara:strand:+ start:6983 stop:7231 length:249 start_codon:yes stop_codon:yes gene_type:complete